MPAEALLARLHAAGVQLNPLARQLLALPAFQATQPARTVALVHTTVAGLGLGQGGTWTDILATAAARGWLPCPLDLAPHLRLAWLHQPEGLLGQPASQHCAPPGSVTVVSLPPVPDDEQQPQGFYLRTMAGVPWLRGYRSWPGHRWAPGDALVLADRHASD